MNKLHNKHKLRNLQNLTSERLNQLEQQLQQQPLENNERDPSLTTSPQSPVSDEISSDVNPTIGSSRSNICQNSTFQIPAHIDIFNNGDPNLYLTGSFSFEQINHFDINLGLDFTS
jgi:hypothetical protein